MGNEKVFTVDLNINQVHFKIKATIKNVEKKSNEKWDFLFCTQRQDKF